MGHLFIMFPPFINIMNTYINIVNIKDKHSLYNVSEK